ncbi:unnamed protein product [Scytosiphon promiscuus]
MDPQSSARGAAQRTSSGGRPSSGSGGGASSSVQRQASVDGRRPGDGPRLTSLPDLDRGRPSAVQSATSGNGRRLSQGAPVRSRGPSEAGVGGAAAAQSATSGNGRRLSQGAPVRSRGPSEAGAGGATGRSFGMGGGASDHERSSRVRESQAAPSSSRSRASSIRGAPFGRLGAAALPDGIRPSRTDEGKMVTPSMTGEELHSQLVDANCPPLALAALLGILLHAVAPHMVQKEADAKKAGAAKGERVANGLVSHIFVPWSFAFIGDDKTQFSSGLVGNERNNPYLAAASHVWPGAKSSSNWLESFLSSCGSARSVFHGATREGLTTFMIYLIDMEEEDGSSSSNSDIFRGARERLADVSHHDPMFYELLEKMFSKCLDAHRRSAGQHLQASSVLGSQHLMRDFVAELATPLILHALVDAEGLPVSVIQGEEAPHCLATRKAREFSKLKNGGFQTPLGRAFQKRMWYHVYVFMSSKRRTGYGLKHIPMADFAKTDIVGFIAPYAVDSDTESEDLIVPETLQRGEDTIIDCSELEDFLRNHH